MLASPRHARFPAALITVLALFTIGVIPSTASAATTVGSDLTGTPTYAPQADRTMAYGDDGVAATAAVAPADGQVTSFKLKRGATGGDFPGNFQLAILTPQGAPAAGTDPCPPVGEWFDVRHVGPVTEYTANAPAATQTVTIDPPVDIHAGDRIGISQGPAGVADDNPATAASRAGASMWDWFGQETGPDKKLCPDDDTELLLQVTIGGGSPPAAPGRVTGLRASAGGTTQINFSWDSTPGASSYDLFARGNPGSYPGSPSGSTTGLSGRNQGLGPGTTRCYEVRAVNGSGPGPRSAEVCATTNSLSPPLGGGVSALSLPGRSSAGSATVGRSGAVVLKHVSIPCPAGGADCNVSIASTAKVAATSKASAAKKKRSVKLGRAHYAVKAGRTGKVHFKLSKKARRLLKRLHKIKAKVKITVKRGNTHVTRTVKVKLKAKKSKH